MMIFDKVLRPFTTVDVAFEPVIRIGLLQDYIARILLVPDHAIYRMACPVSVTLGADTIFVQLPRHRSRRHP